MKHRRNLAKGAFCWRRVKGADVDQMNGRSTKGLSTAEDLGNIETGLELIENQDKFMRAGLGAIPLSVHLICST